MSDSSESRTDRYRAVILDMDGTLIDSNAAHVHAWVEALREFGHEVEEKDIWPYIGMGGDNLLPAAMKISKESEEGEKISERRGEIFKASYAPHLKPFPEVRPLLERMKQDDLKLIVATSSPEDEVAKSIDIVGIKDLLEDATSASDAGKSKPDPDVVQAAGKVGIRVIAFRCGGFKDEDLKGALAIYDDAADLLAGYDESPLG